MARSLYINRSPNPSPRSLPTSFVNVWWTDQPGGQLPLWPGYLVAFPPHVECLGVLCEVDGLFRGRLRHSSPCRTTRTSTRGDPRTMTAARRTTEIDAATVSLGQCRMPPGKTGTAGTRPPLTLPRVAATPSSLLATNHPSQNRQSPIAMLMSVQDGLTMGLGQVSPSFLLPPPSSFSYLSCLHHATLLTRISSVNISVPGR